MTKLFSRYLHIPLVCEIEEEAREEMRDKEQENEKAGGTEKVGS